MSRLEGAFILFSILFLIVFLIDYLLIKRKYLKKGNENKKKKNKNNELTEISYLIVKFKLDKNKLPIERLLVSISFINAFIIALVAVAVIFINIHIILQLLLGFILLMSLIYSIYEILGRYLVKKGYMK